MNYTDEELRAELRATIKAKGCLCRVEIELERPYPEVPDFIYAHAHHDNWCPLALAVNRRSN